MVFACDQHVKVPLFVKEKDDAWDMVSQLPDEILIPAIARLKARDAVWTSFLSKRWTDIYTFVRDVNFNCLCMFRLPCGPSHWDDFLQKKFVDGVDKFFHRHSSYKMRSIKLSCCFGRYLSDKLNQWICSAGRLGVEKLILNFWCLTSNVRDPFSTSNVSDPIEFSFQLRLLSEVPSLEHLELFECPLKPNLTSPCYSLKTLHLRHITLVPSAVECILSNCLSLQTLVIHSCKLYPKLRIHGPNLQLEVLSVGDTDVKEIELYASNLITLECTENRMIKFSFDYVPKLHILFVNLRGEEVMPFLYNKLAKDLPQLSSLIFQTNGIYYQEMRSLSGVARFNNLRQLVLAFNMDFKSDLLSLSLVLEMCPVLQEFHLLTLSTQFSGEQVKRNNALSKSQLKKVEWSGFRGTDNEMSFAKYILKSIRTLEQMYICNNFHFCLGSGKWYALGANKKWSDDRREMMCEWLQRQAISKNAQVIYRHILADSSFF